MSSNLWRRPIRCRHIYRSKCAVGGLLDGDVVVRFVILTVRKMGSSCRFIVLCVIMVLYICEGKISDKRLCGDPSCSGTKSLYYFQDVLSCILCVIYAMYIFKIYLSSFMPCIFDFRKVNMYYIRVVFVNFRFTVIGVACQCSHAIRYSIEVKTNSCFSFSFYFRSRFSSEDIDSL